MRKSIKVAPGIRLNVSKSGVGASVGGKRGRYSAHSSGRRTVSAGTGIPGVYYQQSAGGGKRSTSRAAPPPPAPKAQKPGLFAPKGEKELYRAIRAQDVQAIRRVGDEHPDFRLASYSLSGLMLLQGDAAQAKSLLDVAFATGANPAADPFVSKYLATRLELSIADGVTAELPVNRTPSASHSPSSAKTRVILRGRLMSSSSLSRPPTRPSRSASSISGRVGSTT